MTCIEKLAIEHPEDINEDYFGGCAKCPSDYNYLGDPEYCKNYDISREDRCYTCWNRNIPETDSDTIKLDETKKENDSMSNNKKTKAMLQEEVEQLYQELNEKEKELAKFDKYKKYEEMANDLFAAMTAMKEAGFTHNEAFVLLKSAVGDKH